MQWYNYSHAFTIAKIIDSCSTYMLSPSFHHSARLSLSNVCSAWFSCSTLRKFISTNISTSKKNWFFSVLFQMHVYAYEFDTSKFTKLSYRRPAPPPPKKIIYYINGEIPTGFRLKFPVEESSWIFWQLSLYVNMGSTFLFPELCSPSLQSLIYTCIYINQFLVYSKYIYKLLEIVLAIAYKFQILISYMNYHI